MKKRVSVRMLFAVLWRVVCQTVRATGRLLGVKNGWGYTRVVWRLVAGVIATFVLAFCITALWHFLDEMVYREWIRPYTSDEVARCKTLSDKIEFQQLYYRQGIGRVYDNVRKKVVLEDVSGVQVSDDKDSLALFTQKGKCGYLDRFTGKVVIPPIYSRAWIFSEGIAAVEKDGRLVFIDRSGSVVIDKGLEAMGEFPDYRFQDGYCVVHSGENGMSGLIDRQGNWALQPEYGLIYCTYGMWKVKRGDSFGLFSESMDTLYSPDKGNIFVSEKTIEVRFKNHTARRYDYEGNVLVDFVIDKIENMEYETTRLQGFEEAGGHSGIPVYGVADCQKYMVMVQDTEYYGLLDRKGKRITLPDYTSIEPIAKDLYFCLPQGIIINNQGKRIE